MLLLLLLVLPLQMFWHLLLPPRLLWLCHPH